MANIDIESPGTDEADLVAALRELLGSVTWSTITPTWVPDYYLNKDTGLPVFFGAGFKYTKVALDSAATGYRITGYPGGPVLALAYYYDASDVYLGCEVPGSSGGGTLHTEYNLTLPADTAFIGMTWSGALGEPVLQKGVSTDSLAYPAPATGVEIVWLGTSIPAGSGSNAYPAMLASQLGITVHNLAIGSSPLRRGVASLVGGGDTYGWYGCSWRNAAWGLMATVAEKQYFIDNYASLKTHLTSSPPATLSGADQTFILSTSYESLLAPYLGDPNVIFVVEHAHNDWTMADDLSTGGLTSRDRGTFYGAFNSLVDYIRSADPFATIVVQGHYENARKANVSAAQAAIAAQLSLPIMKLWEQTGWTQDEATFGGDTKTMTEWWMTDDLHPHSDTTGAANRFLAARILPWLRDLLGGHRWRT